MMKNINIKFWIAIFISIIAVRTHAQTYEANFSISDFEIAAGETKVVEVSMTSKEENIRGFQVTITIPQELAFVRVSGTEARPKFAALNYSRAPGDEGYTITTTANMGSIKSAVIASKNDDGYPYYGTSGTIFTFAVKASDDIIAGKHNIKFSDIEIVKEENISINPIDIVVTATVLPTGVSLSKNSTSIMEGNTETLSAELLPGNVAAGSELSWKSSDEKVATISNGVITAVSVGNATITVTTSNGKTATCSVTVTEDVNKTANSFKTTHATILSKTTTTVTSADLVAINAALEDYDKLSSGSKTKLATEKSKLDSLKNKAEELKATEEAVAKFKSDNAGILGKTTANVKSSDLSAINKALDDYSKLSEAAKAKVTTQKTLLDNLKAKAEEIKAAEDADAAATAEANKFKSDNATILSKTTGTVASADLSSINKALDDYSKLSEAAKAKVATQKTLLDALKTKAEEIKAAEDADAAATTEANKFKSDNATILGKTTANVASSDLSAISKALDDYSKLSEAAKAKVATQKTLLDALKTKAEEIKAIEDAVAKFKSENAEILEKTTTTVASSDLPAIDKALEDYGKLSEAVKVKLMVEKNLLDKLKSKAEELKAAEEADAAATAEANKFKSDNATILGKTTATVTSEDLSAISKALDDYSKLSEAAKAKSTSEKTLLDELKAKAEEIKAIEDAVSKFKSDNATTLSKTTSTVTSSDLAAINKALEDYNSLSDAAKAMLSSEKTLIANLKTKAEELKAAEEADAAATAEAEKFKTDNAEILSKTIATVASVDLPTINLALGYYDKLSDAAKAKLTGGEKDLLDALKTKAEELKASEDADAVAAGEAEKFKTDNAEILGKTIDTVTSSDLPAITFALDYYDKLSDAAKAKLIGGEKTLLDDLKSKAEELKAAEDADAAATAEADKFKKDNATILGKSTSTVTSSDIEAIKKALDDYGKLSDAAKEKLTDGEKTKLDSLKEKAEKLKAEEEADAAAEKEADDFYDNHADILTKTVDEITAYDKDAIDKALEDYDKLSDAAKDKLTNGEKALLDSLKDKVESIITSISNVSSYYDKEKWYDLSGKVVNKRHKGFAIINGKKVFVK